ncbi:MAG: cytochrome P450 [Polyangiales bacterium]
MTAQAQPIPRIPGPRLLGYMPEFRRDAVSLLLRIAREQPDIARIPYGPVSPVVISSPALAHEVLVEKADAFVKSYSLSLFAKPLLGRGLLTIERDEHKKRRRMLAPPFMPRRIAEYAREIVERSERSAARLAGHTQHDMAAESMELTLEIVLKTLFDAEMRDAGSAISQALPDAMNALLDSLTTPVPLPPPLPSPANLRLARAVRVLDKVVYRVIAERRARPTAAGDLLNILLEARDEDDGTALSDRELRDETMTMVLAGHETTANALAWTLYALARAPEVQRKLDAELARLGDAPLGAAQLSALPYTQQVVKESMRLYPPVHVISRRTARDVMIGPYQLKRNGLVILSIVGIHRRPDLYPDPERFDPERFSSEREKLLPKQAFMPFSAGPRVCIGNHFAMMEAQLILATWLRRLRFELITPDQQVEHEALITLRPRGGLPLRIVPRTLPTQVVATPGA